MREPVWYKKGETFSPGDSSIIKQQLDPGIYSIILDSRGNLLLNRIKEKFEFNYKIYGLKRSVIDRIIKSFNKLNSNLGVIFNGIKGTGKTVSAEIICNELNLPVIIIDFNDDQLPLFLNNINQDVVLFFDEFEKNFESGNNNSGEDKTGDNLLSLMDGVFNNKYKKLFLLTTNNIRVNENLIQRPGRIRYVCNFENLEISDIKEIVNDILENKDPSFQQSVIDSISTLELITVDIVKSICVECNIHGESPDSFFDIFNIKQRNGGFEIFHIVKKGDIINKNKISFIKHNYIQNSMKIGTVWNMEYIGCDIYFEIQAVISSEHKIYLISFEQIDIMPLWKNNILQPLLTEEEIKFLEKNYKIYNNKNNNNINTSVYIDTKNCKDIFMKIVNNLFFDVILDNNFQCIIKLEPIYKQTNYVF